MRLLWEQEVGGANPLVPTNFPQCIADKIPAARHRLAPPFPLLYTTAVNRVGIGYDVHQLKAGRPLVLGGVTIEHSTGLDGHSDADVLCHALCDSLLGASGAGDLGKYFPDTDNKWKGVSSLVLLKKSGELVAERGFQISNIDTTIVAQQPKIGPHIESMTTNISETLKIDPTQINIKATTTERLGFTGREEGIAAYAVALLKTK